MDTKIKLRVQGLTNSQIQSGAYALILAEENGARRVPIIVGTSEAQSIAIALEHITPPRPLTHDLFMTFAQAFGIQLREVFIYKFEDGVFYSGVRIRLCLSQRARRSFRQFLLDALSDNSCFISVSS